MDAALVHKSLIWFHCLERKKQEIQDQIIISACQVISFFVKELTCRVVFQLIKSLLHIVCVFVQYCVFLFGCLPLSHLTACQMFVIFFTFLEVFNSNGRRSDKKKKRSEAKLDSVSVFIPQSLSQTVWRDDSIVLSLTLEAISSQLGEQVGPHINI